MTSMCKLHTNNHFDKSKEMLLFSRVIKSSYHRNFTVVIMDELKR